jgi:hypothetical protein
LRVRPEPEPLVLTPAETALTCTGGALTCTGGALTCTGGVLTCTGGVLTCTGGVLTCTGGAWRGRAGAGGAGAGRAGTGTVTVVVVAAVLIALLVRWLRASVVDGTTALTAELVADWLGTTGTKLSLMSPASGVIPAVTDGRGLLTTLGDGAGLTGMLTETGLPALAVTSAPEPVPDDPPLG